MQNMKIWMAFYKEKKFIFPIQLALEVRFAKMPMSHRSMWHGKRKDEWMGGGVGCEEPLVPGRAAVLRSVTGGKATSGT
jgi:hypothetical protein